MLNKHSLVRTIYLYLFSLIGLALLVVGVVRFIDMGLKIFVFTKAEEPEKIDYRYYPVPYPLEKLQSYQTSEELTNEEIESLKALIQNYESWKEREGKIDYLASKRQREASNNLAMILVGFPIYFYHWRIIRNELKEK